MSLQGQRQELVDALADVDGVKAHKYRPRALKTGDVWPLLEGMDRELGHDFAVTWRAVVILPSDEVKASEWFDAHHEPIADALADFGVVERIEPGAVATEAGDLEAMFLTVRREA